MGEMAWFWIPGSLLVVSVAVWAVRQNRERNVKREEESSIANLKKNLLGSTPWCVGFVNYDGVMFEVRGWALPPGGEHEDVTFTLNGVEMQRVIYPEIRQDIAEIFSFYPGADRAAFRASSMLSRDEFCEGHAVISCVNRKTLVPITKDSEFYFPDDVNAPPLPQPERRRRIGGTEDVSHFRLIGYSTYMKIAKVLMRSYGRTYGDFDSLLDWGCGCGRFSRYFKEFTKPAVTGVDIDRSNIEWCQEHLVFANFETVPLRPPTKIRNEQFDLIIGISVMTHLRISDQLLWLEELARVARPGAVVLLTTLGPDHVSRLSVSSKVIQQWISDGFMYDRDDGTLKGYIESNDYYGTAYMTHEFIRNRWSRFFMIESILPSYIGNHQDLVVLRKPAGNYKGIV